MHFTFSYTGSPLSVKLDEYLYTSFSNHIINQYMIFRSIEGRKANRITNCEICLLSAINLPREKNFLNRIKYLNIILMRIFFNWMCVFIDISIIEYQISFSNNLITLVMKTINKAKTRRKIWTKTFHASKNNIRHPSSPEIRFLSCIKIFVHLMSVWRHAHLQKKLFYDHWLCSTEGVKRKIMKQQNMMSI